MLVSYKHDLHRKLSKIKRNISERFLIYFKRLALQTAHVTFERFVVEIVPTKKKANSEINVSILNQLHCKLFIKCRTEQKRTKQYIDCRMCFTVTVICHSKSSLQNKNHNFEIPLGAALALKTQSKSIYCPSFLCLFYLRHTPSE